MRTVFTIALIAAALAIPLHASDKPDFSGTWKLDVEQSTTESWMPRRLTLNIEHQEPRLKYTADGLTDESEPIRHVLRARTDGQERRGPFGSVLTGQWERDALVLRLKFDDGFVQIMRFQLANSGRQLLRDVTNVEGGGEMTRHEVYVRQ